MLRFSSKEILRVVEIKIKSFTCRIQKVCYPHALNRKIFEFHTSNTRTNSDVTVTVRGNQVTQQFGHFSVKRHSVVSDQRLTVT